MSFALTVKETSWRGGGIGDGPGSGLDESHELVRLQPSGHDMIAPQWKIGVGSGSVMGSPVGWAHETTKHTLAVRFYRPGYETIEVAPGDEQKEFKWKAVADLAGKEKAVDDLIADRPDQGGGLFCPPIHIHPAASRGNSSGHRQSLLFCADEYDHIAKLVTDGDPNAELVRNRLAEKAKKLRALADGK
jgi:hypothetical protein